MKKIKNLTENQFLKLFFAFFAACFLVAAVCMPDRNTMFTGLWNILTQPSKISANYFAIFTNIKTALWNLVQGSHLL